MTDQEFFEHEYLTSRRYCPHCKKSLSIKTYKAHKRLFYIASTKSWHHPDVMNNICDTVSEPDPNSPPSITEVEQDGQEIVCADSPPCVDVLELDSDAQTSDSDEGIDMF